MKTTAQQHARAGRGSGGATGHGFKPGVSGNPGGRPRSMATAILDRRPTVSRDLVDFWTLLAFGTNTAIERKYGMTPTLHDRRAAAGELADRLHGKPVQTHEMTGADGGPISYRSMGAPELDARIRDLQHQIALAEKREKARR